MTEVSHVTCSTPAAVTSQICSRDDFSLKSIISVISQRNRNTLIVDNWWTLRYWSNLDPTSYVSSLRTELSPNVSGSSLFRSNHRVTTGHCCLCMCHCVSGTCQQWLSGVQCCNDNVTGDTLLSTNPTFQLTATAAQCDSGGHSGPPPVSGPRKLPHAAACTRTWSQ